jgi:hypothetical protein
MAVFFALPCPIVAVRSRPFAPLLVRVLHPPLPEEPRKMRPDSRTMRFAKIVFTVAGIWGIVVLMPLFFLLDVTGRQYAPPGAYPQFFYGFLSVAMAWQIAFLLIGSSPARFRPLMIPSIVEKLGYVATLVVLHGQARITATDAAAAVPDLFLGVLFIAAFAQTRKSGRTE